MYTYIYYTSMMYISTEVTSGRGDLSVCPPGSFPGAQE